MVPANPGPPGKMAINRREREREIDRERQREKKFVHVHILCVKDDIENSDANGLKRFPEVGSSHGIPPKRLRDVLGTNTDTVSTKE